jgi:hypothetical protein
VDILRVRHGGGESGYGLSYVITAWMTSNVPDAGAPGPADDVISSCFNVELTPFLETAVEGTTPVDGPKAGANLQPFEEQAWSLAVSVVDQNTCQAQVGFVVAIVEAEELNPTDELLPPASLIDDLDSEDSSQTDAIDRAAEDSSQLVLPNTGLGPAPKANPRTGLWITAAASVMAGGFFLGASAYVGRKQRP